MKSKHRNAGDYLFMACCGLVIWGGILVAFGIGNSELHTFLLGSAIAAGGLVIDFIARQSRKDVK